MRSILVNFVRCAVVVVGVAAAMGSATAPGVHNVERATTVRFGYEATWTALIDLFADRGWPISSMAKDSGLIVTDWMNLNEAAEVAADCGGAGISVVQGTQVRFNVRVKGASESTEVSVNAGFRQIRMFDGNIVFANCTSRGYVETTIHQQVASRAAKYKAPAAVAPGPAGSTQPGAAQAQASPRGFYCATASTTPAGGLCSRMKSECSLARDAASSAVALDECRLVETAWCVGDRCAPSKEACERVTGGACVEQR